jgi:carbamoyl-phosphate synthase large subunit
MGTRRYEPDVAEFSELQRAYLWRALLYGSPALITILFTFIIPMPKDTSIKRILVIGSGPIVIGQGCEFDYSGVQACKALREEGYEVVLINSNPATIMTDPEFAFRTYIEPITPEIVREDHHQGKAGCAPAHARRPDGAEHTAMSLHRAARGKARRAHDRREAGRHREGRGPSAFQKRHAQDRPRPAAVRRRAHDGRSAQAADEIGTLPLIIRPAYTLGGTGGGIAYNREEFESITARASTSRR